MVCPVKASIKSILFMSLLFFTFSLAIAAAFEMKQTAKEPSSVATEHNNKKNCREKVKTQQDQIITSLKRIENQI